MNLQESIERNVLSHLIAFSKTGSTDYVYEVISKIEPALFTVEKHRILYSSVVKVIVKHRKVDILALHEELSVGNNLEMAGGHQYLAELTAQRERTTSLSVAIGSLISADKKRRLIDSLETALQRAGDTTDVDSVINSLDSDLYSLSTRETETMVDIAKTAESVISKANNAKHFGCYGFSWGIASLDMLTAGIELGKTYVVGATKKSGKSKFVISAIKSLVEQKVRTHFLSLEMNGESVVKELISAFAEVNNNVLKMPLDVEVENRIRDVVDKFKDIEIDTQSYLNVMQIRHKVRQASQRGVKVFFLDYLQRMNFDKKGKSSNDAMIIAETCAQIADIAKEFNVAFVYLSQLRNSADSEMADISMLKDSGGIAESVDCILILNNIDRVKKNYEEEMKTNEVWINVEQRSGASGLVKLKVDLSQAKFAEDVELF